MQHSLKALSKQSQNIVLHKMPTELYGQLLKAIWKSELGGRSKAKCIRCAKLHMWCAIGQNYAHTYSVQFSDPYWQHLMWSEHKWQPMMNNKRQEKQDNVTKVMKTPNSMYLQQLVSQLVLYGTFSTNRLYHATEVGNVSHRAGGEHKYSE